MAADRGQVSPLVLLDLSAAFDTVDHVILIDRLHHAFGLQGAAQTWMKSFITNRTQSVSFSGRLSSSPAVTCGVPQESVLGSVLFLLYTADVLNFVRRHRMGGHSYADDTQVYSHFSCNMCNASVLSMVACIGEINSWMTSNRLNLNTDKNRFYFTLDETTARKD